MADLQKLRHVLIEKQEIILKLTNLNYAETVQLIASLSSLITNLDRSYLEAEIKCNSQMVQQMEHDPRCTITKAETYLKSTESYVLYRELLSLKQCAARGLSLAHVHLQYLTKASSGEFLKEYEGDES